MFSESAQKEYESKDLTILSKDLTTNVLSQQPQFATNNIAEKIKRRIKLTKMKHHNEELQKLRSTLAEEQKPLNEFKKGTRTLQTAQKINFSNTDFFSKCDQIYRKLRIWSHLLEKSLMENFKIPLSKESYDLTKQFFWNLILIRYD